MSWVVGSTLDRLPRCALTADTLYEPAHAPGAMAVTPRMPSTGPQA